jgi:arylamine N-acetyltransferase
MCPMDDIFRPPFSPSLGGGMLLQSTKNACVVTLLILWVFLSVCGLNQLLAQPRRLSPEDRTEQMKERLKLTDDQAASILAILKKTEEEMRKEFESHHGDREAMRNAMMTHRKETNDKIREILTEGQQKVFDEMLKETPPREPGPRGRRDG